QHGGQALVVAGQEERVGLREALVQRLARERAGELGELAEPERGALAPGGIQLAFELRGADDREPRIETAIAHLLERREQVEHALAASDLAHIERGENARA